MTEKEALIWCRANRATIYCSLEGYVVEVRRGGNTWFERGVTLPEATLMAAKHG